jgi:hypothetical protein
MNCVEFGFDRSRGFGSARGQFWPIAIDRPTSPYNIASTTLQQVIKREVLTEAETSNVITFKLKKFASRTETDLDLTNLNWLPRS